MSSDLRDDSSVEDLSSTSERRSRNPSRHRHKSPRGYRLTPTYQTSRPERSKHKETDRHYSSQRTTSSSSSRSPPRRGSYSRHDLAAQLDELRRDNQQMRAENASLNNKLSCLQDILTNALRPALQVPAVLGKPHSRQPSVTPAPSFDTTPDSTVSSDGESDDAKRLHLRQKDYPNVQYWTRDSWSERSQGQGVTNAEDTSKAKPGTFPRLKFIEDEHGVVASSGYLSGVKIDAFALFDRITRKRSTLAESWTKYTPEEMQYFRSELYKIYPELRYCDGYWKVDVLGIEVYPEWKRRYKSEEEKKKKKKNEPSAVPKQEDGDAPTLSLPPLSSKSVSPAPPARTDPVDVDMPDAKGLQGTDPSEHTAESTPFNADPLASAPKLVITDEDDMEVDDATDDTPSVRPPPPSAVASSSSHPVLPLPDSSNIPPPRPPQKVSTNALRGALNRIKVPQSVSSTPSPPIAPVPTTVARPAPLPPMPPVLPTAQPSTITDHALDTQAMEVLQPAATTGNTKASSDNAPPKKAPKATARKLCEEQYKKDNSNMKVKELKANFKIHWDGLDTAEQDKWKLAAAVANGKIIPAVDDAVAGAETVDTARTTRASTRSKAKSK